MTILMTADSVGGVWTYALDLCRGLTTRGVRVVLAVMGAPLTTEQRRAARAIRGVELQARPFRLEWMPDAADDVARAGDWLLDLARAAAPDVVHVNGYAHAALPFGAPVLVGAHSCVLSWFHAVRGSAPPSTYLEYEQAVRRGLAAADLIVAPSRAMALSLLRHYAPQPPVLVIHNGRDAAAFAPGRKGSFVLTAGRLWDDAKNVALLAAAAAQIPWPVFVAGDGAPAAGGVRPLGFLSSAALVRWMGAASIYALPARYEPFGLSVVEAASAGCALVLGDIASLRELWEGAATFVDPEDAPGLAGVVRRLIADPAALQQMRRQAQRRARRYGADAMVDRYRAAYAQLAAAGVRPSRGALVCAS
jgi:glycosyltransferase involved in cell wall biosynthesis